MSETRFNATKLDANKPPMDLIPWEAMTGVAQVLDFGRSKYAPHNWRKGFLWCRLSAAALRHIFAWLSGEDNDPESGFSHIDHATCCLMFLSAHIKGNLGKDDRACKLLTEGRADLPSEKPAPIPAAHVPPHKVTKFEIHYRHMDGVTLTKEAGPYVTRALAEQALKAHYTSTDLDGTPWFEIVEVETK